MFLRSKVQEMILRRRSRSMNGGAGGGAQRGHVPDQAATSSTVPRDGDGDGDGAGAGSKSALFGCPRLLHSASLPAGGVFARGPVPGAEPEASGFSTSPTSVLDAAAGFASGPDAAAAAGGGGGGRRRPWRDGRHGLADALDCAEQQREGSVVLAATSPAVRARSLARSCSLDRRVEFGVKNKSSWLPLRGGGGVDREAAAAVAPEMEPSSEDYTCVISRGPNPRTVHIFGDRVVEGAAAESSPRPIHLPPAPGERGFLSL
ncbi:hypothetical protein ACP4OV_008160 [Aristida adscensionis]